MKVLALNSSPRNRKQSKTELLLSHLVQGMQEAGAQVELIHLREKKIKNCQGCFTCWTKTPGECVLKDDMTSELFPKWLQADLVIYASPLYHYTVNAAMKSFIERTLPVLEPFFVEHQGHTVHPLRHPHPGIVLLSVAGFPEERVFQQLSAWGNFVFGSKLVAEIYRPGAEAMTNRFYQKPAEAVLSAAVQAGRELVLSNQVSTDTMDRLRQPIVEDLKLWHNMGNLMWKTCIAQGITPMAFAEKEVVPRPDTLQNFLMLMTLGFNPVKAADAKAVLQFEFSGSVQGTCHCVIRDGKIQTGEGRAEKADLTIQTPFDLWMDIMTGKTDGQKAFLAQQYQVDGDLNVLMRLDQFFGK